MVIKKQYGYKETMAIKRQYGCKIDGWRRLRRDLTMKWWVISINQRRKSGIK